MIWYLLGGLIGIIFFKKKYNLTFWQAVWNGIIFAFGLYFGFGTILGITSLILGLEDYTEISIFHTILYAALTLGSIALIKQLKNKKIKATISERKRPKTTYEENSNFNLNEIIKTSVVGVTFEGRQRLIQTLTSGQPIKLIREPENKHDSNAIKVLIDDNKHIGYINKSLAKKISPIIDDELSREIVGEIVSIYSVKNKPSVLGVKIRFKLKDIQNDSDNSINRKTKNNENELILTSPESYARCPRCGRNDRAQKLKALYEYETAPPALLTKLEPPKMSSINPPAYKEIPDYEPPDKPVPENLPNNPEPSPYLVTSILFGSLLLMLWFLVFQYSSRNDNPITTEKIIFAILSAVILILFFVGIRHSKKLKQKFLQNRADAEKRYENRLSKWKHTVQYKKQKHKDIVQKIQNENRTIKRKYYKDRTDKQKEIALWGKLYYCYRDDTVFIPDTGDFSQVNKLHEFLQRKIKQKNK